MLFLKIEKSDENISANTSKNYSKGLKVSKKSQKCLHFKGFPIKGLGWGSSKFSNFPNWSTISFIILEVPNHSLMKATFSILTLI